MFRKNKDRENGDPEIREFRSVRIYSNFNGEERNYGYDYSRDKDGKEVYKEYGDPSAFELEGDIEQRIRSFERLFDDSIFSFTTSTFSRILPSIDQFFGNNWFDFPFPQLTTGNTPQPNRLEEEATANDHVSYDFQVEGDKLFVIVELPGFSKKDVKIRLNKNNLHLDAENEKKQLKTIIPIEHSIDKNINLHKNQRTILGITFP
ncbi:MAG: hypothetical protein ACTSPI_12525 [Candidatus Heimdallarchaeaceae archaeon]